MSTLLFTHPSSLDHEMGDHHPERPDRIRAVNRVLEHEMFFDLYREQAPKADIADIERVHAPYYVEDLIENQPVEGYRHIDGDTAICPATITAALHAAGAAVAATDEVMSGKVRNAFCALRPPGHHAEYAQAMGFCFFNNAAIAAHRARAKFGAERVAVVDFDVHHGNGTQALLERYKHCFYGSSHQSPAFPGTGAESETGFSNNVVNVELQAGTGSVEFRAAWSERILPRLHRFQPDLIVISAGFDAHARDPLAYLRLTTQDFGWITREILEVADKVCDGRVVSVLEGGYDLEGLAASVATHVRVLMGQ